MVRLVLFTLCLVLATPALSSGGLGNIVIDNQVASKKKAGVGPVVFPHTRHEEIYKCADCHPKIFVDKRGANKITMKLNMDKQYCGSPNCHNSPRAFPLFQCEKCHNNASASR
ncbi:MAG TPA: c(7)-type cytochrome triheme domain-containing protein [Thermodesulfobacteriota bacterium]|nr:c(7)-type cytochrome triheme domain-containing protein [Thermodesulfobacteriota bacterium]